MIKSNPGLLEPACRSYAGFLRYLDNDMNTKAAKLGLYEYLFEVSCYFSSLSLSLILISWDTSSVKLI